jgi:hypothetical protein
VPESGNLHSYQVGGLTLSIRSDLPDTSISFHSKFDSFRVQAPGTDIIKVHHHFYIPDLNAVDRTHPIYKKPPWEVHRSGDGWVYLGIHASGENSGIHNIAFFDRDHSSGDIYHPDDSFFRSGILTSLTLIPTDQILLARVFPQRNGVLMHACGMVVNGHGLAFVGHSEAGKTTTARMLAGDGQLLCDDRVILRRWPEGFRVHGTWSHGDIPIVSPNSAPLRAVFLLEQAPENRLIPLEPGEAVRALPQYVVRPLVTRDWWEKVLDTIGYLAREVPVYRLRFDKSGRVFEALQELL